LAGITGHVKLDDNLDRLGEYLIWHRPSLGADFQPFVDIKMTSSRTDDIVTHRELQKFNMYRDAPCINLLTYLLTYLLIKCISLFSPYFKLKYDEKD